MRDKFSLQAYGVHKKFCSTLRRSMIYGMSDIGRDILGLDNQGETLRPGEFWALSNIDIQLHEGECLAVIGPNGSGKSTLLKILNKVLRPDSGNIFSSGRVAGLIELGAGFHPLLSGRENIYINGLILGLHKKEIDRKFDDIVDFAELGQFIDTPVKFYSSGMYVRLGFAIAAQLKPEILLIDEILAVGDVRFRMKCFEHIQLLARSGVSIILVSHNMSDVFRVSDKATVLQNGTQVYTGAVSEAVDKYHAILASSRYGVRDQGDDGGIKIGKTIILDHEGNDRDCFSTGDDIQFEIDVYSDREIHNSRLIIALENPQAGILSSISSHYTRKEGFYIRPGVNRIRCLIKSVPLNTGFYAVNVNIYGQGQTDFLDRVLTAAVFRIEGSPQDHAGFGLYGPVFMEHEWSNDGSIVQ